MKGRNKVFVTILIIGILIFSTFVVIVEYQFLEVKKEKEETLPIYAKAFASETTGYVPLDVNFSSLVLNNKGSLNYTWNFGDNQTSDEKNPIHSYNEIGTYNTTLTVVDASGQKKSDFIQIIVKSNEAPQVGISLSSIKPVRPFVPIIRLPMISQNYYGQNLRRLIESPIFPKSLLNLNGFIVCTAIASSPQGNKIVSYKWELSPPTYSTISGKQIKPLYEFEGQNITIPLLIAFGEAPYDLTVKVTDEKGLIGTSTITFNTQVSPIEAQIRNVKALIKNFRLQVWHTVLKASFGEFVGEIIYENLYPLIHNFPVIKLLLISKLIIGWGINPTISLVFNLSSQFLQKHPLINSVSVKIIYKVLLILENIGQKNPKLTPISDLLIDVIHQLLEKLNIENKRPVVSNEIPTNKAKALSTNFPEVAITVEDPEGDPFNITIHGDYVNNITLFNQHNDTFIASLINPLPNLSTITWFVNVSYGQNRWINQTYWFTTW